MPSTPSHTAPLARDATPYAAPQRIHTIPESECDSVRIPRLFAAGDRGLLERPAVAIVGSRAASPAGLALTTAFAADLARHGFVVMSGLAQGIDTAAHRAAIAVGGRTVAVVGTPLDRAYPVENGRLQERIHREHLLLSPFAPGTCTNRGHFPVRNRVMARLSLATVVVEARDGSGTLHQVRECLAIGRPLFIAERLVHDPGAAWSRSLLGRPHVFIARHAGDVIACVSGSHRPIRQANTWSV